MPIAPRVHATVSITNCLIVPASTDHTPSPAASFEKKQSCCCENSMFKKTKRLLNPSRRRPENSRLRSYPWMSISQSQHPHLILDHPLSQLPLDQSPLWRLCPRTSSLCQPSPAQQLPHQLSLKRTFDACILIPNIINRFQDSIIPRNVY